MRPKICVYFSKNRKRITYKELFRAGCSLPGNSLGRKIIEKPESTFNGPRIASGRRFSNAYYCTFHQPTFGACLRNSHFISIRKKFHCNVIQIASVSDSDFISMKWKSDADAIFSTFKLYNKVKGGKILFRRHLFKLFFRQSRLCR